MRTAGVTWLFLLFASVAGGCGSSANVARGVDAGTSPDDGGPTEHDGGSLDGGAPHDGGSLDGGSPHDGGPPTDGGWEPPDAEAPHDGGPPTDAGGDPPDVGGVVAPLPCAPVRPSGALLELGHVDPIEFLQRTPERLLSYDTGEGWRLWDASTAVSLAGGVVSCQPGACTSTSALLVGELLAVRKDGDLEIRSAADGAVRGTLTGVFPARSWGIASDGSALFFATESGLSGYGLDGANLFSRAGDYSRAAVFAAPAGLLVARGAAGEDVVETVTWGGQSSTSAAFLGAFKSWFLDGQGFLTAEGDTYRVYGADAVQKKIMSEPFVGGVGDYVWSEKYAAGGRQFSLFRVSGGDQPVLSRTKPRDLLVGATERGIVVFDELGGSGFVIDLSAAVPSARDVNLLSPDPTVVAMASDGSWVLGNQEGAVHRGDAAVGEVETYGCGRPRGLAMSAEGTLALTAANQIMVVDVATRTLDRVVPFRAGQVALSPDGSVLTALDDRYRSGRSLDVFALPSGELIRRFVQPTSNTMLFDFALSRDGSQLLRAATQPDSAYTDFVMSDVTGANVTFSLIGQRLFYGDMQVSPTGLHVAITTGDRLSKTTNIYESGSLVGAADGTAVAWLDDDQLLLRRTVVQNHEPEFSYMALVDKFGALKARTELPNLFGVSVLEGGAKLYSSTDEALFDTATGEVLWRGDSYGGRCSSAADDSRAVYCASGGRVVVEEFP